MQLRIVAVGKLKKPYYRDATDDYLKRLRRYLPTHEIEVRPERKLERKNPNEAKRKEGASLLSQSVGTVIALDEAGAQLTSTELADLLASAMRHSRDCSFVVGGALGLSAELKTRADRILSLSAMTLPHELARLVLTEQLYRAMTIVRGQPYHKGNN